MVFDTFGHSTYCTIQNLRRITKFVKPTNKKTFYTTLGTGVINSPMSPLSLPTNSESNKLYTGSFFKRGHLQ